MRIHQGSGNLLIAVFSVMAVAVFPAIASTSAVEKRLKKEEQRLALQVVQPCKTEVQRKAKEGQKVISGCPCPESERQQKTARLQLAIESATRQCELKAIERLIAVVDEERTSQISKLKSIKSQFETQMNSYITLTKELTKQYDETLEKIEQLFLGAIMETLMAGGAAAAEHRVDQVIERFKSVRDVRRVRKDELKSYIVSLRSQLTGKSREEAKRIMLRTLREEKKAIEDFEAVGRTVGRELLKISVSEIENGPVDQQLKQELELSYGVLLTSLELAVNHGIKTVRTVGKAAGILGLAPEMLDAATTLWAIAVQTTELEALDRLEAVSRTERQRVTAELDALIKTKRALEQRKQSLQGVP